jgi:hypothetical protein
MVRQRTEELNLKSCSHTCMICTNNTQITNRVLHIVTTGVTLCCVVVCTVVVVLHLMKFYVKVFTRTANRALRTKHLQYLARHRSV